MDFDRSDDYCFVCGMSNPSGLRLRPEASDGSCSFEWTPTKELQGWPGITHGGVVTALLDEAMAYASMSIGGRYATAQIAVSFHRPVRTGVPALVRAKVEESRGRRVKTSGEILQGGEVLASGSAVFIRTGG
ncbi:MAG: Thioesterase superfamily protein [candidate division Hyd24-12 bacterium ADurb.Bin004]|nr:MAG: Thioesterase superfamily protein [candidate division Hyd24-12 bacterium ADurb.Bin004]